MLKRVHGFAVVLTVLAMAGASSAVAGSFDEFPEIGAEAMAYYESDLANWASGPVKYLMLDSERDLWKELETDAERADFVAWFWDRRDDDLRDVKHPFKIAFYQRVAEANDRFSGFPRGWKSDQGRVWVTLGRPDSIRPRFTRGGDGQVWVYFTNGRDRAFANAFGEVHVAFARIRGQNEIVGGFGGPGVFPLYVQRAFEYTRLAAVVDASLPFRGTD